MNPMLAVAGGFAAGAIGSGVQDIFFMLTRPLKPKNPDVFEPPEPQQKGEQATQAVGRRFVEGFMQRGPVQNKKLAGQLVHYLYGGAWGALYGLISASTPRAAKLSSSLAYGFGVWVVSDDIIVPAFRVAAWPQHYPAKTHAYAIAAHLAWAAGTWVVFRAIMRALAKR